MAWTREGRKMDEKGCAGGTTDKHLLSFSSVEGSTLRSFFRENICVARVAAGFAN
jgi:hypothetical protein